MTVHSWQQPKLSPSRFFPGARGEAHKELQSEGRVAHSSHGGHGDASQYGQVSCERLLVLFPLGEPGAGYLRLETPVQLGILITGCQGLFWKLHFLELPSVSRSLRGSQWPYGGQSDRRAYANLKVSSYSYPKSIVGRVNFCLQQCLLAPLTQLAKGQDKHSPGCGLSELSEEEPDTLCPPWVFLPPAPRAVARTHLPSAPHFLCNCS